MATIDQIHNFCGAKDLVRHYSNFIITFPTIWNCAGDFFQGSTEIQNDRHRSTLFIFLGEKTQKLKSEIIQILQSHYLP